MRTWLFSSVLVVACARAGSPGAEQAEPSALDADAPTAKAALSACATQRARLERSMDSALDTSATQADITTSPDFTLALEAADGHQFVHTHGDSSLDARYESASTSKWVAAAVILDLVDDHVLRLDSDPAEWLSFWHVPGVTLAQLLSFTSGFGQEPMCIDLPNADFADCVQRAYDLNARGAIAPGSTFEYSSTHLQIAGLMAVRAAGAASWSELFASWQVRKQLFPTGVFDLPSRSNPRLAGGMHWRGREYLEFLRAIRNGSLLRPDTLSAMLDVQRGSAAAEVADSPVLSALNQDWAYGFGNWLECPSAIGPNTFDCGPHHRNSSPGAYGAYPFVDFDHAYIGVLARQGDLGTFPEGLALFGAVADQAARWADACNN